MSKEHLLLGSHGEKKALVFLKKKGFVILARNYKTKLGEIDIIARDKDTLAFIEVKTRQANTFGSGFEAVIKPKQKAMAKAALTYLKEKNLLQKKARFDVISILFPPQGETRIDLLENAFELDPKFSY